MKCIEQKFQDFLAEHKQKKRNEASIAKMKHSHGGLPLSLLFLEKNRKAAMKDIKVTLLRNDSPAQNRNKANVSRKTKSINEQQCSLNLTKKAEFLYNQLSDVKLNQIHMKYANLIENSIRTLPSKHIKQVVKNIDHTNEEDIKIQLTKA